MANPLHASHYADQACHERVTVVENQQIAKETFRVRFDCPSIAQQITPGQFLMVKLADMDDPLIGRPFALYDTADDENGNPRYVDVVYLVGGKMTQKFQHFRPGQPLNVWGPLGNGFTVQPTKHLVMVAGGIGQTPFLALAKEFLGKRTYGSRSCLSAERVSFCYGARTSEYLADVEKFEEIGVDVRISTDDGSAGHHGLVTELLSQLLDDATEEVHVVCCGPEPMMEAVSKLSIDRGVSCQVSLETPMACGIGICFSCVAKIGGPDDDWDFKRTCVEGPVFDAQHVCWD